MNQNRAKQGRARKESKTMTTYATLEEYRTLTGDTQTDDERLLAMLETQSAKLRSVAGITPTKKLSDDALILCRELVCDAVRKAVVPPTLDGFGGSLTGATTASFSANGFQQSVTMQNPSGSAYFDRSTLSALKSMLGTSQLAGHIMIGAL